MKLLVAYNGSDVAKAALDLARKHAEAFGATICILNSAEGGEGESPESITKAGSDLENARACLAAAGVSCQIQQLARGMSPAEDIVRFARENSIDQIFVGVEKKSKTQKIILGSTAQFVILKAGCPVTTVNTPLFPAPF